MTGKDPYRFFRLEAHEITVGLGSDLLALETHAEPALVARLLRRAHTLKGAARVVKHRELAELAHALEDELEPLRAAPVPQRMDRALALVDQMAAAVAALPAAVAPAAAVVAPDVAPAVAPGAATPPAPAVEAPSEAALLDDVLTQLAELRTRTAQLRGDLPVGSTIATQVDGLERSLREVRVDAERLRFVPASTLFAILARVVRDASQATGKQVAFHGEGGETRVDAQVLHALRPALIQLARNAVVHGIAASGAGRVVVSFAQHGTRIVVACRDDGRGLDLEAIRDATGAPAAATTAELIALLLRGGVTTARTVNELAGRGIGLDIVRAAAHELRGEVRARTQPGGGTTFVIDVPVALSAVPVLGVATLERSVAVPVAAIRRVVRIHTPQLVAREGGGFAIPIDDVLVPVGALSVVLGFVFHSRTGSGSAIILADADGTLAALSAERTLGVEDAIVHALPARAAFDPIVRGFTLDADGLPRPVLDPTALIALIRHGRVAPPGPRVRALPILVVDDSLTSRMVEQSILESAGYDVELAASAEEGLAKLALRAYALVLVDVEMPGMDGFGFVATLRATPAHASLPAILVTSRDAPADRRRGRDAGAQGYVIKAELDQAHLIAMIRGLVRA